MPCLTTEIKLTVARVAECSLEPGDIHDHTPLSTVGVHSLRLITLLLHLESTFEVAFPEEAITPANFNTVHDIRATLLKLQPELAAPERVASATGA